MAMVEIDPAFILPKEQRPNTQVVESDEIPIIDLSDNNEEEVISKIGKACEEWGFFQVINHAVDSYLSKKVETVAKSFFTENSLEEKKKVKRDEVNVAGYHDGEHTKEVRDWKEIFIYHAEEETQVPSSYHSDDSHLTTLTTPWPQDIPLFREVLQEYSKELEKLAHKILELVTLSLGLPKDKFKDCFKNQLSIVALNYYPEGPCPELVLGVGPHKDTCAITILAQDHIGGLQVKRSDGEWVPVKPTPNAFVINLGEVFQVWSNDRYMSVVHRVVVNPKIGRFSNAFFLNPNHEVTVKPVEELVNEKNPAKYRGYNFGKFYTSKNRSDFKKCDEESIQIHHFKIEN